ncbi:hypothetical protein AWQ21_09630 [Picosynechococcus sp. PCC 7003]|nr:hypothetical protein AWQ21_09630 [Picosynechococcus sp. PCC 7003]
MFGIDLQELQANKSPLGFFEKNRFASNKKAAAKPIKAARLRPLVRPILAIQQPLTWHLARQY